MSSRHLWAIVCDDVRAEVGNKSSYVGVYAGDIIVTAFPTTLPKLCTVVYVRTQTEDPFTRLILRVLQDEVELAKIEISEEQLEVVSKQGGNNDEQQYITIAVMCQFSPLTFNGPCKLRFRADTERDELKGGSVSVRTLTNAVHQQ